MAEVKNGTLRASEYESFVYLSDALSKVAARLVKCFNNEASDARDGLHELACVACIQDCPLDLKDMLKEKHGIDLNIKKDFGPRNEDSICIVPTGEVENGSDFHLKDSDILRMLVTR